jgi:hypothetical protein
MIAQYQQKKLDISSTTCFAYFIEVVVQTKTINSSSLVNFQLKMAKIFKMNEKYKVEYF